MQINFAVSDPMYGQEGGGVAYTAWVSMTEENFWRAFNEAFDRKHRSRIRAIKGAFVYTLYCDPFTDVPLITSFAKVDGQEFSLSKSEAEMMIRGAQNFKPSAPQPATPAEPVAEKIYRYRTFNNPKFSSNPGWDNWEFIDEKKYHEIVAYTKNGAHYQVQALDVTVATEHKLDLEAQGLKDVLYRVTPDNACSSIVSRDTFYHLKETERDRRDAWTDFEISRDDGETWESA